MLQIISLGAGVQSSVMALMAAHGELPMPYCAIFADTQFEPKAVYDHLDWLETQLPFPVRRVSNGSLKEAVMNGGNVNDFLIPTFSQGGIGRRQCTTHYKINAVVKEIRRSLGLAYRQRGPKKVAVKQWIGISTDEAVRMKPSRIGYIEHVWPLIDAGMSRQDCLRWFEKRYPLRPLAKSACIACPFHNDLQWRDMKINDPESFAEAVKFDKDIRVNKTTGNEQFVHRSCKPLDEVDLRNLEDMGQLNFFENECEGMCGV